MTRGKKGIAFGFLLLNFLSAPLFGAIEKSDSVRIQNWCSKVEASIAQLKWKIKPCDHISWKISGESVQGVPLVYAEFGDLHSANTTLIFSTVHGDEITPFYLGIQLANWLKDRQGELENTHVVIAPLVNPDGFLSNPRTRMNARGVDVNRNFATKDWKSRAVMSREKKGRLDPRRFPGNEPMSEPETLFQSELIKLIHPSKIMTIHAPLNVKDFDGPSALSLSRFPVDYVRECDRLRKKMNATSTGFFPGSLGNYAGHELGIPTLTLELPSTDATKAERYWKQFSHGIRTMIQFTVPHVASGSLNQKPGG